MLIDNPRILAAAMWQGHTLSSPTVHRYLMEQKPLRPPSWKRVRGRYPHRLRRWLAAVEWATEWAVFTLRRWAVVDLLQLIGAFSLLFAALSYCAGTDDRAQATQDARKARQYQAWQVLINAQGKRGDGGRTLALQDLHLDGVSLSRVDLAMANLTGVVIPGANLPEAIADSVILDRVDLRRAVIEFGSYRNAQIRRSDLRGVYAQRADFSSARITYTCLQKSVLYFAQFEQSRLFGVDLSSARLVSANFKNAVLRTVRFDSAALVYADFRGAKFIAVSFDGADLRHANIYHADISSGARSALLNAGAVEIASDEEWAMYQRNSSYRSARTWMNSEWPLSRYSADSLALVPRSTTCMEAEERRSLEGTWPDSGR